MATVRQIADMIERLFPPKNVCMQDSIGLMVGSLEAKAERALVCLDCTEKAVKEASEKQCELIISHHPLIFGSVERVTDASPVGRIITSAIKNGISVYSAHTNMDCSVGGINGYVASLFDLKNTFILEPNADGDGGVGVVGDLTAPHSVTELTALVAEKYADKHVKAYGEQREISRVAVINGSGGDTEYIDRAISVGAQCLITSEIKHHVALYAVANHINLIEAGHYESERVYIPRLVEILTAEAGKNNVEIQFIMSESESSPAL